MKRRVGVLLALFLLAAFRVSSAAGERTVTDHLGNSVRLPENIERIAIVSLPPLPSVLAVYQGGYVGNVVAILPDSLTAARNSILSKYAPGLLEMSTEFYRGGQLNIEELMKLNPDVVFYSGSINREMFDKAGIPAVAFAHPNIGGNVSTLNTLEQWLSLLQEVLRKESKTKGIVEHGRRVEEEIARRVRDIPKEKRARALMISNYTDTALSAGGRKSFGEYWCEATGSINVALDAERNTVNMEQIYEWAPERIFLTTFTAVMPRNLYDNTAAPGHDWSNVPAVRDRRSFKFPLGMHRWWPPSSDTPLALWWVAKMTYPELFEDIEMTAKIKEYYGEFYGMELSDDDVEWIMNPGADTRRRFF